MSALALLSVLAAMLTTPLARGGDDKAKLKDASVWMRQKLTASQNILAGLTTGDFSEIEKNAQAMLVVGYLEKWVRADAPGYQKMMKDFEYANKSLTLSAREKNLDGATLAFMQLTVSCVHCHKIVRDAGKQ
jgi:hypothetical protein